VTAINDLSSQSSRDLNLAPDYTLRFFSHLLSAFLPLLYDTGLPECHELAKSASDLPAMNHFTTRNAKNPAAEIAYSKRMDFEHIANNGKI